LTVGNDFGDRATPRPDQRKTQCRRLQERAARAIRARNQESKKVHRTEYRGVVLDAIAGENHIRLEAHLARWHLDNFLQVGSPPDQHQKNIRSLLHDPTKRLEQQIESTMRLYPRDDPDQLRSFRHAQFGSNLFTINRNLERI